MFCEWLLVLALMAQPAETPEAAPDDQTTTAPTLAEEVARGLDFELSGS